MHTQMLCVCVALPELLLCECASSCGVVCLQVGSVEAEMRDLLSEVSREKRAMEGKVRKLSLALQELQQDVT